MERRSNEAGNIPFFAASPKQMPDSVRKHKQQKCLCKLDLKRRVENQHKEEQCREDDLENHKSGPSHLP